jgi:para-nitrobenzyl esterase
MLAAFSSVAGATSTPLLSVGESTYVGGLAAEGSVKYFLGLPFAEPPTGPLRWQPPRLVANKYGRVEALQFAPACAQGPHIVNWYRGVVRSFGGDPGTVSEPQVSEDCLYLNIWKPARADAGLLPVVVYIHGGSNKGGWSYEPNYIGIELAQRDVVVVSIAYRLGVFGFFAHPELPQANFGLLDQVAALQWVNSNIVAAGGDPANVTVMGESAGGNNITHLLVSPLAKGLFQRVIHQSAGWALQGRTPANEHQARGLQLQKDLLGNKADIGQLRNVPVAQLLAAADKVYAGHSFDPVVDGYSMVQPVKDSLGEQTFPKVDLLIGSNADEWLMYLDDEQTVSNWMAENLSAENILAVQQLLGDMSDKRQTLDKLITADNFVCPSMSLAHSISARGGRSWFYYFTRQREGEQAATMGAYHGAELPYVFNTHDDWLPTGDVDHRLTEVMMAYWVNFIRSGDPNGDTLPSWSLFDRESGTVQWLDEDIVSKKHESSELCNILMLSGKPG